ncbi:exosome non-catalytic core subunit rrp46 [Coemansia sp. Benny D115]|nr:exosome non-catalytic core subunit rrp46 [Coemansia sp. Benny D115]
MSLRPDRREAGQIRALNCTLGSLSRTDGSAQFSSGGTSMLCGVHGPVDVKLYDEKLDRAYIEVKHRPDIGTPTTKDKWVESAIRQTFERNILAHLHPRTLIQINLQVREDDGSAVSAAINATTMALVDAGVAMRFMVAAATCAVVRGELLVDPVAEEIKEATAVHTFAFTKDSADPVYIDSRGEFTMEEYNKCQDLCALAADRILAFMRTAIEGKVTKESHLSAV